MNLYTYAIDEQNRIIALETSFQPFVYLITDTVHHTADTRFRIVLPINLVKDITYQFLCQSLGVEHSSQTVTFLLLVTENG